MNKKKQRVKLNGFWQWSIHYCLTVLTLSLFLLSIYYAVKTYISSSTGERTFGEIIGVSIISISIGFIFWLFRWRLLYYKEIKVFCTDLEFKEAIRRTVKELELKTEYNKKNKFKGYFSRFTLDRWIVRIIKEKDIIYFNSIPDPDAMPAIISFGFNRKARRVFLQNLRDVLKGEPEKTVVLKEHKVWSLNRILIRFVSYPFCIFLIVLGIYAQLHPINWKSGMAGIGAIVFASYYLYADLQEIISDIKKRKQKK